MIGRTSPLDAVGGVLISAGLGLLFFGVAFFPAITALAYAWARLCPASCLSVVRAMCCEPRG